MKMYCGNEGSQGGKRLAEALGIRRIKHNGSTYRPQPGDRIINWGCSGDRFPDRLLVGTVLNRPSAVLTASNKRLFFEAVNASDNPPRLPVFTHDQSIVQEDIRTNNSTWVARQSLTGHSGHGIVIMARPEDFVLAPLYTKYVKKKEEYRVHIVRGEVIDVQRKARDRDNPNPNWQVRSHENGFVYVRNGVDAPADVELQAKRAFETSGLDFGAVDVIWNGREAFVLEINTAPGLEGTTVEKYAEAFRAI